MNRLQTGQVMLVRADNRGEPAGVPEAHVRLVRQRKGTYGPV